MSEGQGSLAKDRQLLSGKERGILTGGYRRKGERENIHRTLGAYLPGCGQLQLEQGPNNERSMGTGQKPVSFSASIEGREACSGRKETLELKKG